MISNEDIELSCTDKCLRRRDVFVLERSMYLIRSSVGVSESGRVMWFVTPRSVLYAPVA